VRLLGFKEDILHKELKLICSQVNQSATEVHKKKVVGVIDVRKKYEEILKRDGLL